MLIQHSAEDRKKRMPLFLLHYYLLSPSIFLFLLLNTDETKRNPRMAFKKKQKEETKQLFSKAMGYKPMKIFFLS